MTDLDKLADEIDRRPPPKPGEEHVQDQDVAGDKPAEESGPITTPFDYVGHPAAKKINKWVGEALEDPELASMVGVGESAAMTLEENLGEARLPGHYWLALSGVLLLFALGLKYVAKAISEPKGKPPGPPVDVPEEAKGV